MTEYLYDLSGIFNQFYKECQVRACMWVGGRVCVWGECVCVCGGGGGGMRPSMPRFCLPPAGAAPALLRFACCALPHCPTRRPPACRLLGASRRTAGCCCARLQRWSCGSASTCWALRCSTASDLPRMRCCCSRDWCHAGRETGQRMGVSVGHYLLPGTTCPFLVRAYAQHRQRIMLGAG